MGVRACGPRSVGRGLSAVVRHVTVTVGPSVGPRRGRCGARVGRGAGWGRRAGRVLDVVSKRNNRYVDRCGPTFVTPSTEVATVDSRYSSPKPRQNLQNLLLSRFEVLRFWRGGSGKVLGNCTCSILSKKTRRSLRSPARGPLHVFVGH